MSSWNDLANSERWHGLVSFIRNWGGPFDSSHGMTAEELDTRLNEETPILPMSVREWYILAGNWNQGGFNVWIKPEDLQVEDEADVIVLLTDDHGINDWSIRVSDIHLEDPPVVLLGRKLDNVICPHFSQFAAAMVMNDFLIADEETGEQLEPNPGVARANLQCLIPSPVGDLLTDAPLEIATVIVFVYPNNSAAIGKSRTPEGHALLERLQA